MANIHQIQDYLSESETFCWKLFSKNNFQKDFIGEYLPEAASINAKESFEKLEKMARMYDEMYPGTVFLIEPRKSSTSNKSGIMASLSFSMSEPTNGTNGLSGNYNPVVNSNYITLEELTRREELMRKEADIMLKNMLLEQEQKRFEEEVKRRKRGLAGLQKKYNTKSEAFQNGLELAFFSLMKEAGLVEDDGGEPEKEVEKKSENSEVPNEKLEKLNDLASFVNQVTSTPEEVEKVKDILKRLVEKQKQQNA